MPLVFILRELIAEIELKLFIGVIVVVAIDKLLLLLPLTFKFKLLLLLFKCEEISGELLNEFSLELGVLLLAPVMKIGSFGLLAPLLRLLSDITGSRY